MLVMSIENTQLPFTNPGSGTICKSGMPAYTAKSSSLSGGKISSAKHGLSTTLIVNVTGEIGSGSSVFSRSTCVTLIEISYWPSKEMSLVLIVSCELSLDVNFSG